MKDFLKNRTYQNKLFPRLAAREREENWKRGIEVNTNYENEEVKKRADEVYDQYNCEDLPGSFYKPAKNGRPTILVFHDNKNLAGRVFSQVDRQFPEDYGILCIEYSSYHDLRLTPSMNGLVEDGNKALSFLKQNNIGNDNIILMGRSMGCVVAAQLARQAEKQNSPFKSLILNSPFSSVMDMFAHSVRFLKYIKNSIIRLGLEDIEMGDNLKTLEEIKKTPTLILGYKDDKIIPKEQYEKLHDACKISVLKELEGDTHVYTDAPKPYTTENIIFEGLKEAEEKVQAGEEVKAENLKSESREEKKSFAQKINDKRKSSNHLSMVKL